ncbi:MAG: 3'(2'),5'-bisphosphate nucleotidase CysQ [Reichenbachiella sp.]
MSFDPKNILHTILSISESASDIVYDYYKNGFDVEIKEDNSPLTSADIASHNHICAELTRLWPEIPIISEEAAVPSYEERKSWDYFWLIDPIDGTKEFVKRQNEFTVNIALIHKTTVVLGVVSAPALAAHYYAAEGVGAFKKDKTGVNALKSPSRISNSPFDETGLKVLVSKFHRDPGTDSYLEKCAQFEPLTVGSSLKFCVIAEGKADLYPRVISINDWDIAAGHAIAKYAGRNVYNLGTKDEYQYNRYDLKTAHFEAY